MSTVQRSSDLENQVEWRISNDALELLKCFMCGIDDVVTKIALDLAMKRSEGATIVRVEAEDIKRAAEMVTQQIREHEGAFNVSRSDLRRIDECLEAKSAGM